MKLRTRKGRPSYKDLLTLDIGEDGNGEQEEPESGSEFNPGSVKEDEAEILEDEVQMELDEQSGSDVLEDLEPAIATLDKGKGKASQDATPLRREQSGPTQLVRETTSRTFTALPSGGVGGRRGGSIWVHPRPVLRLTEPPNPFRRAETQPTNSTNDPAVYQRVNRAWTQSAGPGPPWELLEDRSWWKEQGDNDDVARRPRVYADTHLKDGNIVNLSRQDALSHLPSDSIAAPDGTLRPPRPMTISLGPHKSQERIEIEMFGSHKMNSFVKTSRGHIFNAGGPVWGLDWCPLSEEFSADRSFKQYVAVAPYPSSVYSPTIGSKVPRPAPASIQIWSLGAASEEDEVGQMKCEMVLCLDCGPAHEIRWCPLPSHDLSQKNSNSAPRKLGIVAGTFGDGSTSFFAVPDPEDFKKASETGPIFLRLKEPLLRIELEDTSCFSLDWANSELVAIGCTNGAIAVYHVKDALLNPPDIPLLPSFYRHVHQSAIRSLSWVRVPPTDGQGMHCPDKDPTTITSVGYDGALTATDIRDPDSFSLSRARDPLYATTYSSFCGGPLSMDYGTMKGYALLPWILARGHAVLDARGPAWSISASDYHAYVALASADGSVIISNLLKGNRKGSIVPIVYSKLYQVDYSRKTGEYRMLDNFLPKELIEMAGGNRNKFKVEERDRYGGGAWPAEAGIHRVAWHSGSGLSTAPLLASGMACGLCRVDWLPGRFAQDRIPYGDIAMVRMEDADREVIGYDEEEEVDELESEDGG